MNIKCNYKGSLLVLGLFATVAVTGCAKQNSDGGDTAGGESNAQVHEHPSEGPHGGELVELGNEEYHAELVHDEESGSVTVYVLDSAAKSGVPIDAQEVTINLTHDGQAEQFAVTASPQEGDGEGKSSRFTSQDAELAEELEHNHGEAKLVLTINGKQYRGSILHDHDGEEHDH